MSDRHLSASIAEGAVGDNHDSVCRCIYRRVCVYVYIYVCISAYREYGGIIQEFDGASGCSQRLAYPQIHLENKVREYHGII